jgi:hypothetical protein
MGSHFVSLYSVDPQRILRVFGSNNRALPAEWLDLMQKQENWEPDLIAGREAAAQNMVAGESRPDECEEGAYFIRAFELVCNAWASARAVIECYVDDGWPELWDFVTQTDDPPIDIPVGSSGVPLLGWLAGKKIGAYREAFSKCVPSEEMAERYGATQPNIEHIKRVLADAEGSGRAIVLIWES